MRKINFAIIGCGRIGLRHAEQIVKFGNLIAVCDIDISKAEKVAKLSSAKSYNSIDSLIENEKAVDLIAICTPNGLHFEHTIKCLNNKIHVLCEKPMAINLLDCSMMIKTAELNNKRLFIVKQNRFNPPVQAVKTLIEEGRLGKISSIQLSCFWNRNSDYYKNSWKGTKLLDGGTLFTQFSHFIDLLYWLIGDIKNTKSFLQNSQHENIIEFEDSGVVIVEFYNGAIGTINFNVNSYNKNMEGSLTIFGNKGTVKIGGQYLNELEYQCIEDYKITDLPKGNEPNNYGNYLGSMSNHDKVYENVVDVLVNNQSINANMFDGYKTIEIIEKIYNSGKFI